MRVRFRATSRRHHAPKPQGADTQPQGASTDRRATGAQPVKIAPMPCLPISLRNGDGGTISCRPQIPVRLNRLHVHESEWTPAIQELDEILSDAILWGARHNVIHAPDDDALPPRTTVESALRAERDQLVHWRPYTGGVVLQSLRVGTLEHALTEQPLSVLMGAIQRPRWPSISVLPGADVVLTIRNDSHRDREYLVTWFCDVAD